MITNNNSIHQKEKAMDIKAVKFRKDGFYAQPFVFGGEEGQEKFDKNIRYRGSLQNYLIDTGDEVILVDTGLPAVSMCAPSAATSMTLLSTTVWPLKTCLMTGVVRAANRGKRSLTEHNTHGLDYLIDKKLQTATGSTRDVWMLPVLESGGDCGRTKDSEPVAR